KTPVPGSNRQPLPNARLVGPANPNERVEVTIILRQRPSSGPSAVGQAAARAATTGESLSREEFAAIYGADPADAAKIEDFARTHTFEIREVSLPRRSVRRGGTGAAFSAAFDVQLNRYEYEGKSYRGRVGPVHVPAELLPIVQAVMGLDDRPQASPHLRV